MRASHGTTHPPPTSTNAPSSPNTGRETSVAGVWSTSPARPRVANTGSMATDLAGDRGASDGEVPVGPSGAPFTSEARLQSASLSRNMASGRGDQCGSDVGGGERQPLPRRPAASSGSASIRTSERVLVTVGSLTRSARRAIDTSCRSGSPLRPCRRHDRVLPQGGHSGGVSACRRVAGVARSQRG
jgi:hypothetical protein